MAIGPLTMAAILGGSSALSGGLNLLGSMGMADAQEDAADEIADAQRAAAKRAATQYATSQAMQMPWYQAGSRGLNALQVALGLATPEQVAAVAPIQNEATFDADAFFKAHPATSTGESLQDVVNAWGITPYEYWQQYGEPQGMDFTYKAGYGPSDTALNYGSGGTSGASGLPGYGDLNKSFTIQDFYNNIDPSYEWRKQQGIDALAASGAASGNYGSGNMGVALQNYGQNLASTEYQNASNRWNQQQTNLYNRLAALSGVGQVTAQNLGTEGTQATQAVNNAYTNAANAYGAGQVGAANAWASGYGNLANQGMGAVGSWLNYNQNQQLIDKLGSRNTGLAPESIWV